MTTLKNRIVQIALLTFAGVCFWNAWGSSNDSLRLTSKVEASNVEASASSEEAAGQKRQLQTLPISEISLGSRVLANNPQLTGKEPDSEINATTWRHVRLLMKTGENSELEVDLLRPQMWLVAHYLDEFAFQLSDDLRKPDITAARGDTIDLAIKGRQIFLDIPELGAVGAATVVDVLACPPIEDGRDDGRRYVTGLYRHNTGQVVDIHLSSGNAPIRVTPEHPFWSVDRAEFVPVGQLNVGEALSSVDGQSVFVTGIEVVSTEIEVFNLEVDVEHVYHVGKNGVLVHNIYGTEGANTAKHHLVTYFANASRRWDRLPGNEAATNFAQDSQKIIEKALSSPRLSAAGRTVKNWTNNLVHLPNHSGPHPLEYHQRVYTYLKEAVEGLPAGTDAYADAVEGSLQDISTRIVKLHEAGFDINDFFKW